jgi:hypothetical protein
LPDENPLRRATERSPALNLEIRRRRARRFRELIFSGILALRRAFADNAFNTLQQSIITRTETTHKGNSYPGEHEAIVPRKLFDAVQRRLAELRPVSSGKERRPQDAPLTGLIFDETGTAMLPTYSIKRKGLRYRYYASKPTLKGGQSSASISRIPAPPLEAFIVDTVERLGFPKLTEPVKIQSLVSRIEIQPSGMSIAFNRAAALALWRVTDPGGAEIRDSAIIDNHRAHLGSGEILTADAKLLTLSLPVRAHFRGGRAHMLSPPGKLQARRQDMALVKAVARAHRWRHLLENGEVASIDALASRFKLDRGHVGQTLNLAFLSPAITRAIVRGEQPPGLRLTHLLHADVPLFWGDQEAAIRRHGQPYG